MTLFRGRKLVVNPPRSRRSGKKRRVSRGYWKVSFFVTSKAEAFRLEKLLKEMREERAAGRKRRKAA